VETRVKLAAVAVGILSMAGVLGVSLPSAAAVSPDVNCTQNPATNSKTAGKFVGTNVNIHTGPFTSCTSVGEGQTTHDVTLHCFQFNSNNVLWVYLTDHSINRTGWAQGQFLEWNGLADC
jgi:uncharacterized protein YraI